MGTLVPSSLGALIFFLWVGIPSQVISVVLISHFRAQASELPFILRALWQEQLCCFSQMLCNQEKTIKQEKQKVSLSISSSDHSFNRYLSHGLGTKLGVG